MRTSGTRDHVLAGWAHDLGKPLQVIWAHGRRLAERASIDPQARELALAIVALSNDALGVVDRLVDCGAAESSRGAAAPTNLEGILAWAAARVGRLHPSHAIRIERPLPKLELEAPGPLLPALVNLVDNAVQASPSDRPVRLVARPVGRELVIDVIDHGAGMSDSVRSQAFDPYFSTRPHPRTGARGLGLFEARAGIEAMGGRIELDSFPGRGTRASIRIPVRSRSGSSW
jgi:two-component system sensor histidine kinase RegB